MSERGWCPMCELSLYLAEPWEPNPLFCKSCAESLIGTWVCCPKCRKKKTACSWTIEQTVTLIQHRDLLRSKFRFVMSCGCEIKWRRLRSPMTVPPEQLRPGMKLQRA